MSEETGGEGIPGGRAQADIVVVGAGVMGLWSALGLVERRHDVLLVDAWPVGHPRATSSGESRVIRCGYGGSSFYSSWAWRALKLWTSWQQRWGETLFHRTGMIWMAGEDTAYPNASLETLRRLGIPADRIETDELSRRFPQMRFKGVSFGIFEPEAGAIRARRACIALARAFEREGGRILRARVKPGHHARGALRDLVTGDGARIEARKFLFACGPWLPALFPLVLGRKLKPTRKEVFFFGTPPGDARFSAEALPVWFEQETGCYGIPEIDGRGFKLHPDVPGRKIDPDRMDRRASPALLSLARACLRRRFPDMARAPVVETRVCQYTSTADDHLVFDAHPRWGNAWILGGGSGHAFKHGPVIGEMAADVVSGEHGTEQIPAPLRLSHRPEGRNF